LDWQYAQATGAIDMRGYTHLIAGIAAGYLLTGQPEYLLASAAGALLPDLDSPQSLLGSKIPVISLLGGGHRSWMHSLAGLTVFSLPAYLYNPAAGYAVAAGCMTHLLLDMLNPKGIKLFWPFGKWRHIIGIPSNSTLGNMFISSLIIVLLLTT
jgi:inner membrane protein